jgi:hypothetical protein
MNKRLFVMDPDQRLPSDLFEGVGRVFDVVPLLRDANAHDLVNAGPWHGAVSAADSEANAALAVARRLRSSIRPAP